MINHRLGALFASIGGAVVLLFNTFFIVTENEQALVFQFGQMRRACQQSGLYVKIPFVQEVKVLEKRLIDYEKPAFNITLLDQKRIVVDVYALYRINDPLKFFKAVGNEFTATMRLDEIIPGTLKAVFGGFNLSQIMSESRRKTMEKLLEEVNHSAQELGIEVIDARIRRSDLPPKNSEAIFERMRAERQRAAKEVRAQGEELAREICSGAEKERTILLAEAEKKAQLLRGEAEAKAMRITAEAIENNPSFYSFYRSLEAYKSVMTGKDTMYILSLESKFLQHLNDIQKAKKGTD